MHIGADNSADPLVTTYPTTQAELDELDGFSTTGGVIVKFSAPIDPRGLVKLPKADPPVLDPVREANEYTHEDSPLLLVNVDPSSPEHGKAMAIVPVYYAQAAGVDYDFDEYTLIAQPATPLRPGVKYALAVTDQLLASDDTPVGRSTDMNAALEHPSDAYSKELVAALGEIETSVGLAKKHVAGATVFTTESATRSIVEMAKARRAAPAPTLVADFSIETPYAAPDPRVRFEASYQAPEFRKPQPDGKWELDESGAPKIQQMVALQMFLAFSDATKSGPRPVVIYQHGLGGDKDGCWGTAQRLAQIHANGAAVVAIDSPEHGSRGGTSGVVGDVYGFFGIDPKTNEFDIGRARFPMASMAWVTRAATCGSGSDCSRVSSAGTICQGDAEPVLEPAALTRLTTVDDERVPQPVDLVLAAVDRHR